jgi:hypothetical protein
MSFDYLAEITSASIAIVATMVGVILVWWHEGKRTEKTERENRVKTTNLLINELGDNLMIAEENSLLFTSSIENLKQSKRLLLAPTLFNDSSWRIAQANGIASFVDTEAYKFISGTYVTIAHMNAQFNAREGFRISNMALTAFNNILTAIDQQLQAKSMGLVDRIKETIARLREAKNDLVPKPSDMENHKGTTTEESPTQVSDHKENIERVDRLFEIGLLLASVLSAAILGYASAMYSLLETTLTNTLHEKLSGINFAFRITTVPLVILLLVWLVKEAYPSSWERRLPVRRCLKEFDWAFLGYFLVLDFLLFLSLSFYTSYLQLYPWVLLTGVLSFIFTFFATWQYKKCAETNRKIDRGFVIVALAEHAVLILFAYAILSYLILWLENSPTPWI